MIPCSKQNRADWTIHWDHLKSRRSLTSERIDPARFSTSFLSFHLKIHKRIRYWNGSSKETIGFEILLVKRIQDELESIAGHFFVDKNKLESFERVT